MSADRLATLTSWHADWKGLRVAVLGLSVTGFSVADTLTELGDTIDGMRERLLMEPFALHREFFAARGPVTASAVGEAKQAKAWLDRLRG